MGRRRRFLLGAVVSYTGIPCVVVDYRQDRRKRGSYRLVRLTHLPMGKGYGPAIWVDSWRVASHDYPDSRPTAVQTYRANVKLGADRGCSCECCAHVAIPVGVIRPDGSLEADHAESFPGGPQGVDVPDPDASGSTVP